MNHLYRHFSDKGELLYVGISLSAMNRLAQHKDHSHWFSQIKEVRLEPFETRQAALIAEQQAIIRENPLYNKRHKQEKPTEHELRERERLRDAKNGIIHSIVTLKPVLTVQEAAQLLCLSTGVLNNLIQSNEIGHILLPPRKKASRGTPRPKVAISGFQVLDYLEYLQNKRNP